MLMIVYVRWNVATTIILLNVLISLFSSAYEDVCVQTILGVILPNRLADYG